MIGILLINLGTPEAPTETAVRNYLNVFLSDPYVITLPKILRDFLVQKIILPKRPKLSAHAYQQIWTEEGSPLLVNSLALKNALSEKLKQSHIVSLGMRYGNPSIENAIDILREKKCDKIIILPLFPQFSKATTQSALDHATTLLKQKHYAPEIKIISDFHDQDFYIHSYTQLIQQTLDNIHSEFLLLSYHGLPKRKNTESYRTQCYKTTALIAEKLQLSVKDYQVAFQSRLGFTKWIQPYTDKTLKELRKKGMQHLSIVCPSFVADCIETLEEINIRLQSQWRKLGGVSFCLIPCLNSNTVWVDALANYISNLENCYA